MIMRGKFLQNCGNIIVILVIALTAIPTVKDVHAHTSDIFTVDTNSTADDDSVGNGVCHIADGGCSLRAAIHEANADGNDTINFDRDLIITDHDLAINWTNINITGTGHNVILDGTGASAGESLLALTGSGGTISHLTIRNAPIGIKIYSPAGNNYTLEYLTVINNADSGIMIIGNPEHTSGSSNVIQHNEIGAIGRTSDPCIADTGNGYGINLQGQVSNTTITDNYIVCNHYEGISIFGSTMGVIELNNIAGNWGHGIKFYDSDNFTLWLNFIGNLSGETYYTNSWDGIRIDNSHNLTIGGDYFKCHQ